MRSTYVFLVLSMGIFSCKQNGAENEMPQSDELIIAFGSCAHSYDTLKIMDAVVSNNPAIWVWLGDIVYGDTHDMNVLAEKYNRQKSKSEYRNLMSTSEIIGVWDDHDYGVNDAGKNYSKRDESKELLLDFLEVSDSDKIRSHDGVYSDYDYTFDDKLLKIILLDTRYFRDTLGPDMGSANRYLPNEEGDILGEEQWQWFENVLRNSKADFHIVGSSIQVIAEEQGYEKWSNFPKSRDRLFELLSTINPKPLLIISGDRHIAEISKIDITGLDYPLYDFTASGLTHTWGMAWNEPNKYRVDSLIVSKNFGLIKLDWEKANPAVTLEVRDDFDKLIQKMKIDY